MIYHFNFADKKFIKQQIKNTESTKKYIRDVNSSSYSIEQVDSIFYNKNRHIFEQKRGAGYWLWKPYFLNKTFEMASHGDIIIYTDAGSFFIKNIDKYINFLRESNRSCIFFELPLLEIQWSNKYTLDFFKNHYNYSDDFSNQITANFFIIKKTKDTELFVKDYLNLCQNAKLITDEATELFNEHKMFIEHRHDQSILSNLVKIYKFDKFNDPTDYGIFPLRYYKPNVILNILKCNEDNNKYKSNELGVVLLANKRESPLVYFIKFKIRNVIGRFLGNRIKALVLFKK